jgi:tetratricopeptide (TPR) repeat protein
LAYFYDAQGEESLAVLYYEKAIQYGLSDEALSGALLGLGSTYRCLRRYDDAVRKLRTIS